MIRVTIEEVPHGQEQYKKEISVIEIINVNTRDDDFADYFVQRNGEIPYTMIRCWDRNQPVYDLVAEALRRLLR